MRLADLDLTPDPDRDMRVFWENSGRVLSGDVLLAHGASGWSDYLDRALGPERRRRTVPEATFYNGPAYIYFVAGVRAALGDDPYRLLAVQALLSALTIAVVHRLAGLLFDRTVAAVAAVLVALQDTLVFYCGFVLRETLLVLLVVAATWLAVEASRRRDPRWGLAAGAVLGLAWLTRADALLLLPCLLAPLPWRSARGAAARVAAAAVAGLLLAAAPLAARNLALGVGPLTTSAFDFVGVVNANLPTCAPRHLSYDIEGIREVADASDGRLLPALRLTLARHGSVAAYGRFVAAKVAAVWNAYEPWDNASLHYFERTLRVFRLPLVGAGLLLPLGLVGMAADARRARAHLALYGAALAPFAFASVSHVVDRYRLPAYPALAVFAAVAVVSLARLWRGRRRGAAAALLAAALVLAWIERDTLSAATLESASQAYPAIYVRLGRPASARYLLANVRRPTAFERWLRGDDGRR